ncbi:hypothetical protein HPB48_003871 [Haemaphysalis longicornis]|uniref:Uncharacterized protein n=1 Tax=Haemaphysalis longicornis TaxID=44386 RepID=A0A9J6FFG7_HAELO|nr:hypothetical protein HPB48_003871 [Haemaphysalis longicornis]
MLRKSGGASGDRKTQRYLCRFADNSVKLPFQGAREDDVLRLITNAGDDKSIAEFRVLSFESPGACSYAAHHVKDEFGLTEIVLYGRTSSSIRFHVKAENFQIFFVGECCRGDEGQLEVGANDGNAQGAMKFSQRSKLER